MTEPESSSVVGSSIIPTKLHQQAGERYTSFLYRNSTETVKILPFVCKFILNVVNIEIILYNAT
jgi:hypothetical protein